MKLFLGSMFITVALGANLDNTYLPSSRASIAGGSGTFLSAPSFDNLPSSLSAFRSTGSSFEIGSNNIHLIPSSAGGPFGFSSEQYNVAASKRSEPQFRILKLNNQNPGTGDYRFEYETENQISQQESGEQKQVGNDQAASVHGSYSYTAPNGQHITVNYVADEKGFRAEGDHIPTPPTVPSEIQQSLAVNSGSSGNNGYYQDSPENSDAYQGIEVSAARSASRQYLAPAIARANQGGYRYKR